MEKYELEWHELKTEKPRIWGRYLVYFPANDKTNNDDYIDLCYWNGEIFLGGDRGKCGKPGERVCN